MTDQTPTELAREAADVLRERTGVETRTLVFR